MNAKDLRELQAPLKAQYKIVPETALYTLKAEGQLDSAAIACKVDTGTALVTAGLHPATGGDGSLACSGDMLLEALVACAGVTVRAVATALGITLKGGAISAEGDLDFRGTLGIARDAPVGFHAIRLYFRIEADEPPERIETLIRLTERYCVVLQSLRNPVPVTPTVESVLAPDADLASPAG